MLTDTIKQNTQPTSSSEIRSALNDCETCLVKLKMIAHQWQKSNAIKDIPVTKNLFLIRTSNILKAVLAPREILNAFPSLTLCFLSQK